MAKYPSISLARLDEARDPDDKITQPRNTSKLKDWRRQTTPVSMDWTALTIGAVAGNYPASSVTAAQRVDFTGVAGYRKGHRFAVMVLRVNSDLAAEPDVPWLLHEITSGAGAQIIYHGGNVQTQESCSMMVVLPISPDGDCYLYWLADWSAGEVVNSAHVGGFV